MRRHSALLALALATAACSGSGSNAPALTPIGRAGVMLGTSPQRGPSDAWVTIVEFGDFQCPYCGAEAPVLRQLLAANPADVRLVYKHFTLPQHAYARGAAIAAECAADQGKFWEMYDELYAHQDAIDPAHLPDRAAAAGVPDLTAWQACLGTAAPAARVDADMALVAQLNLPGTPTLVVNGDEYFGAFSYDELAPIVAASMKKAESSGIPRAQYYDVAVVGP